MAFMGRGGFTAKITGFAREVALIILIGADEDGKPPMAVVDSSIAAARSRCFHGLTQSFSSVIMRTLEGTGDDNRIPPKQVIFVSLLTSSYLSRSSFPGEWIIGNLLNHTTGRARLPDPGSNHFRFAANPPSPK